MSNVIPIHRKRVGRLAVGQPFADRYRLIQQLGRGGMGEVWLAGDEKIERFVALKVLPPSLLELPGARERFEREARALTLVEHPYVVPLYDWGTEPQPFIVMKRIVGITLREMIRKHGAIFWEDAVCFVIQIADGLAAMHKMKLWHRDVKPENIMADERGNVSILDLGIARDAANAGGGAVTDRIGTLGYVPPEMILGQSTDQRGDLYQLGVCTYELLTGRKPYGGIDEANETEVQAAHVYYAPDPLEVECPEELGAIVLRLLAKDPGQRYPSASEVSVALGQVLRDKGSVPAGAALEPMVQRAMVHRKLHRLAAEQAAAEQAAAAQAAAAKPEERPPVRQEKTEPMGERQRTTLTIGAGFVVQSPASPSARAAAKPVVETEPMDPRTMSLPPGHVPATAAAPLPLAEPTRVPRSVREAGVLPRAVLPAVVPAAVVSAAAVPAAAVPAAPAQPKRELRGAARVAIHAVIALLGVVALVLTVRALHVSAGVVPAAVVSAAPVVSAVAAPPPSSAPSLAAAASAAPPPSATASVKAVAPARSAAPTRPTVKRTALPF